MPIYAHTYPYIPILTHTYPYKVVSSTHIALWTVFKFCTLLRGGPVIWRLGQSLTIRASNGHLVLGGPLPDFPYVPKKQFKIIKIVPFS